MRMPRPAHQALNVATSDGLGSAPDETVAPGAAVVVEPDRRAIGRSVRAQRRFELGPVGIGQRAGESDTEPGGGQGQLGRPPFGHDPATVHDRDPVGEPLRVGQLMGGEQDAHPSVAQGGDEVPGRGLGCRVHPGGRFVEEDELRPADDRKGEPQALPLAARQDAVRNACRIGQAGLLEQRVRIERIAVEPGVQPEDLGRPCLGVDAAGLEHQPDPRPERRTVPPRVEAEDPDLAGVGPAVALDDLDRRRLPGAVRPEQRDDRPRRDIEVEPGDRGPAAVALVQAANGDRRASGGHGRIAASWRSRSVLVSVPIWRDRMIPSRPMK